MGRWFFITKSAVAGPRFARLRLILAIHMFLSDRHSLKAFFFYQSSAHDANTIRSAIDTLDRFIELLDIIAGALRMEERFLAFDRVGSLLGRMERIRLVIGFKLAGRVEDVLTQNFKLFARFLHLFDDELSEGIQILASVALLGAGKDFGVVGTQSHFGHGSCGRLDDASTGRYFFFDCRFRSC